MANKGKFYVVWVGHHPGVYTDWAKCKAQIEGVDGAKYKSFPNKSEADAAFQKDWKAFYKQVGHQAKPSKTSPRPTGNFMAVDAACSGNPGMMEYRGVFGDPSKEIFHQGPYPEGTNNIGEFLAIVHALALQVSKNSNYPIYSDSMNALAWVKKKKCNTKLAQTAANEPIFDLIDRAENWLATHTWNIPLYKWETASWGEIPADFGRK
jgi:ribonuclease HI